MFRGFSFSVRTSSDQKLFRAIDVELASSRKILRVSAPLREKTAAAEKPWQGAPIRAFLGGLESLGC